MPSFCNTDGWRFVMNTSAWRTSARAISRPSGWRTSSAIDFLPRDVRIQQ